MHLCHRTLTHLSHTYVGAAGEVEGGPLDNTTIFDDRLPARTDLTLPTSHFLYLLDHVHPLHHLSENDVLAAVTRISSLYPGLRASLRP